MIRVLIWIRRNVSKKLAKYSEKTENRGKIGRNKVHGGRDCVNYTVTMISHFRLVHVAGRPFDNLWYLVFVPSFVYLGRNNTRDDHRAAKFAMPVDGQIDRYRFLMKSGFVWHSAHWKVLASVCNVRLKFNMHNLRAEISPNSLLEWVVSAGNEQRR